MRCVLAFVLPTSTKICEARRVFELDKDWEAKMWDGEVVGQERENTGEQVEQGEIDEDEYEPEVGGIMTNLRRVTEPEESWEPVSCEISC